MTKKEVLAILDSIAYQMRITGVYDNKPIDGYQKVVDYATIKQFISMIDEAKNNNTEDANHAKDTR